jgi:transcription elongation factor GreA
VELVVAVGRTRVRANRSGHGVVGGSICGGDRIAVCAGASEGVHMADARRIAHVVDAAPDGVPLTQEDFDLLVRELDALRSTHRSEVAERMRQARAFGGATENDELLEVLEESAVAHARIAQLEELVRVATVVEGYARDGGAGLGSTVRVADDGGRTTDYELIGRRSHDSERHEVTLASPVGKSLWGARPGDVVVVALPTGRNRTLRVIDVRHGGLPVGTTAGEGVARAA